MGSLYHHQKTGSFFTFGSSWIGAITTQTDFYTDDTGCSTALAAAGDDAAIQAALSGSCDRVGDRVEQSLRILSRQDTNTAPQQVLASTLGVVELGVTMSESIDGQLVTITSNVNTGDKAVNDSVYSMTTGLAPTNLITFSEPAPAGGTGTRSLNYSASVNGQVTLGDYEGFTDSANSLFTLSALDVGTGLDSDSVSKAYGVVTAPASGSIPTKAQLQAGATYNLAGILIQSSEDSTEISRFLDDGARLTLTFAVCGSDANLLQADLSDSFDRVIADYRESTDQFPQRIAADFNDIATSQCFDYVAGRFGKINFPLATGSGIPLQLEGFHGLDGMVLRAVSAVAVGSSSGGTAFEDVIIDQDGNILLDFVDANQACTGLLPAPAPQDGPGTDCSDELALIDGDDVVGVIPNTRPPSLVFGHYRTSFTQGSASDSYGFVDDADGAPNTPQSLTDVQTAGGGTYDRLSVGQGILFGTPQ